MCYSLMFCQMWHVLPGKVASVLIFDSRLKIITCVPKRENLIFLHFDDRGDQAIFIHMYEYVVKTYR